MKRKMMAGLLTVALSVGMLTGCGSSAGSEASQEKTTESVAEPVAETATEETAEETPEETSEGGLLASIQASGKLVIGTSSGYAPYEFVDVTSPNQEIIGVDMELAKAIAEELGVELVIEDMVFSSLLSSLPAHKIDFAIGGIAPTDERKKTMDFSDSYLFSTQSILIMKENLDTFKTLEDFTGKPMAAQKSTTQEALIQEMLPDSPLVALDKVPDCILELMSGNVAGVAIESVVGEQYTIAHDDVAFASVDFDRKKESAIALEKGNEDLLEVINKVIKETQESGKFDEWIATYSEKAANNAK